MDVYHFFLIAALLLTNAFFVAAEFALVRVRPSQIDEMVATGSWVAKIARRTIDRLDSCISASQLGITLASLALGRTIEDSVEPMIHRLLSNMGMGHDQAHAASQSTGALAPILALVLVTFFHIGLGELVPKNIAIRASATVVLWTAPLLTLFYYFFLPAIWFMNKFSDLVLWSLGLGSLGHSEMGHTEEELRRIIIESADKGHLTTREQTMIENVLNLEEKNARKIMVPRPDVAYLSLARPLEDNLQMARQSGHTRFPLCETDLSRVIGMIHIKDLLQSNLAHKTRPDLRQLARRVPFLPETLRLDKLLVAFQREKVHLAMLVDEFGSVVGMVTLENVLEEVVGPIQDEFDRETPQIQPLEDNAFLVNATCPLDAVIEQCGLLIDIDETAADTIGGFVLERLGRLAKVHDVVVHGGKRLVVTQADPNRVRTLRIETIVDAPKPSGSGLNKSPVGLDEKTHEEAAKWGAA